MIVIAHRGVSAHAPENTLPAFARALDARIDAIETDVRLTADGVLVLIHDDDVARTTNGDGCISEMTYEQVRALDAGARVGWDAFVGIPTLGELIDLVRGRAHLYLEMKPVLCRGAFRSAEAVAHALVDVLPARVTVSSFDVQALATMRALAPHVTTAVGSLRGAAPDWTIDVARAAGHRECHVADSDVTAEFVERAHDAGLRVLVYTVNDGDRARALQAMGVEGVFSDDPAAIRSALAG